MSQPDEVVRAEFAKFAVSEACPMRFHAPDVDSWLDGNDRMGVIEDRYRWWKAGHASLLTRVEAAEGALSQAVRMLAEWTLAVERESSWDGWDEHFKDAAYRPGPLRALIDAARLALRASGTREGGA